MRGSAPGPSAVAIAGAGLVSLAVAMGIGRFAFTPLLPMMLHDGVVDLRSASWLASANYVGYLVGALLCTFAPALRRWLPWLPGADAPRLVGAGLLATSALTLAMALPVAALWPLLRFSAGVASAYVFVYSSGWCLAELARRSAPALGGLMYAGPGFGIVVSGVFASGMVAWSWPASAGWLVFGVLASALTAAVWRFFGAAAARPANASSAAGSGPAGAEPPPRAFGRPGSETICLALAYALAGFGYIVTATFLPVIARGALPGSPWLDLFWPIFGAGIVAGALLATRLRTGTDRRVLLAAAYAVQASGIAVGIVWPSLVGFAVGSALLGLPFTAITFFAMQEVRRLRPLHAASGMGLLTAGYGLGQIAGPPLASWLVQRSGNAAAGFASALGVAAGALLVGALIYIAMKLAWPGWSEPR